MKKLILLISVIIASIAITTVKHNNKNIDSLLFENVESLCDDNDNNNGYAEKNKHTKSQGIFLDSKGVPYFLVFTWVDCFGFGRIECENGFYIDVVYDNEDE